MYPENNLEIHVFLILNHDGIAIITIKQGSSLKTFTTCTCGFWRLGTMAVIAHYDAS